MKHDNASVSETITRGHPGAPKGMEVGVFGRMGAVGGGCGPEGAGIGRVAHQMRTIDGLFEPPRGLDGLGLRGMSADNGKW